MVAGCGELASVALLATPLWILGLPIAVIRLCELKSVRLPADLSYAEIRGLSTEIVERLSAVRPVTLGQAARVPGVTPAAVSLLLVHLKRRRA